MAGREAQAPTAVLQAALSRFHETAAAVAQPPQAAEVQPYIAAATFTGTKPGYYFGTGSSGPGYYRDSEQPAPAPEDAAHDATLGPPRRVALDPEALLREAEEGVDDLDQIGLLDLKGLRRLINLFERRFKDNMEMRMKYSEEPSKFMESEVDLDDAVKRMMVIPGSPELYPDFARTQAFADLLGLLSHENADIAADVLELFKDLTEEDVVQDSEEEAIALVEAMLDANALELLVQRLTSLDESNDDEAAAVHHMLAIFENMIEVKPEVAEMVVENTKLLRWILGKVKQRGGEVDSNKQYTSELLAILMQHSEKNQTRLGEANGIDTILQAIAYYKNRDPKTSDEEEYLENLFDTLCTCLMQPSTRTLFFQAEGVELMAIILKQKRLARQGALKALDFATTRFAPACERLINMAGLKSLFAIFMGRSKLKHHKADSMTVAEEEQRVVSVITNLLTNLGRGSRRDRVAAKFVESEFEKVDRLMEIYTEYQGRVAAEERRLATSGEEYTDEDMNLARLDAGLYTLQQCALIIGNLWLVGDVGIRKRVLTLLHQRSQTLADLRAVLKEHHDSLGDEGKLAEDEKQKVKVQRLLIAMGARPEDLEEEAAAEADDGAVAANGAPDEAAPPLPAADGAEGMDANMDVDMDAEDAAASEPPEAAGQPAAGEGDAGVQLETEHSERNSKRSADDRKLHGHAEARRDRDRDTDRDRDRSSRREGDRDREKEHDDRGRERDGDRDKDRERKDRKAHKAHRDRDEREPKHKRHKH